MPSAGFIPGIPAFERPQTPAIGRTGVGPEQMFTTLLRSTDFVSSPEYWLRWLRLPWFPVVPPV